MLESIRIDKWLWAARFYKTRSMASKAVEGGRVHVNGSRVKAAHKIRINNIVRITKEHLKQEFQVLAIAQQRRRLRDDDERGWRCTSHREKVNDREDGVERERVTRP